LGYASGHQSTGIPRRSAKIAIQDATKLERKKMTKLERYKEIYKTAIKSGDAAVAMKATLLITYEEQKPTPVKPKTPIFPSRFIAVKDNHAYNNFVIGLRKSGDFPCHYTELPPNFVGRACITRKEIQEIIWGLQTLIGDK